MTGVVGIYFFLRFTILDVGTPDLTQRPIGFGFSVLGPEEAVSRFGDVPLLLYGYNIVSSILSVGFSEPRAGVWAFTRDLIEGNLRGWQIVNIVSSFLATALIGRLVWTRWRRWIKFDLEHGHRLVLVFLGVLFGNAVISYPYTKDVIMSPAGVFYALAAYAATRDLLESMRRRTFRLMSGTVVAAWLVVMSATWCVRSLSTHYSLRHHAFLNSSDWTGLDNWLEDEGWELQSLAAVALAEHLREEVARKQVPNPYFWERAAPRLVHLLDPY